jgi:hypothetical protein
LLRQSRNPIACVKNLVPCSYGTRAGPIWGARTGFAIP